MDKDWIKAVTLLCIIAQNNADSMKQSVRYAEIMKKGIRTGCRKISVDL